jgi:hypothetical protein
MTSKNNDNDNNSDEDDDKGQVWSHNFKETVIQIQQFIQFSTSLQKQNFAAWEVWIFCIKFKLVLQER